MAKAIIAVLFGGIIGTALRFGVMVLLPSDPTVMSWSTIAVNVLGSFVLGLLVAAVWSRAGVPTWVKVGVGSGILGSFTTFSAIAVNVTVASFAGQWLAAALALVLSVMFSLLAAWAGIALGSRGARPTSGEPIADQGVDL